MSDDSKVSEIESSLSKNLQDFMAINGWNRTELAKHADLPVTTIANIMTKTYDPRISTLLSLADSFNISLDQLVGRKPIKTSPPNQIKKAEIDLHRVPLITLDVVKFWIAKGYEFLGQSYDSWVRSDRGLSNSAFALKIAYEGRGVFEKDSVIIIDPEIKYTIGDYVLSSIKDNKPTIKIVCDEGGVIYLKSVGLSMPAEKLETPIKIIGVIVEVHQYMCNR